jgi:hypothetical protein
MKMKHSFLFVYLMLFCFIVNHSNGQGVAPVPAAVQNVIRGENAQVNLHTGVANIQVPLLLLPHHNGFEVPVYLNYHAGGQSHIPTGCRVHLEIFSFE